MTGSSAPRSATPVIRCQSACDQPTVRSISLPSTTRISVGTVSISWCQLTRQVVVVHDFDAGREGRIILGVDRDVAAGDERRQQWGDHPARRALLLDDDDQSVRQHGLDSCEVLQDAVVDDVGTLQVQEVPAPIDDLDRQRDRRPPSARRPTAPLRRRRNRRRDRGGTGSAGSGSSLPRRGSPRAAGSLAPVPHRGAVVPERGLHVVRCRPTPGGRGRCRRRRRSPATTAPTTAR